MQILDAISGGFVSALRPTEHSLIYILKKKTKLYNVLNVVDKHNPRRLPRPPSVATRSNHEPCSWINHCVVHKYKKEDQVREYAMGDDMR